MIGLKYSGRKKSWAYQVSTGKLFVDLPNAQSITFIPYREFWDVLEAPVVDLSGKASLWKALRPALLSMALQ